MTPEDIMDFVDNEGFYQIQDWAKDVHRQNKLATHYLDRPEDVRLVVSRRVLRNIKKLRAAARKKDSVSQTDLGFQLGWDARWVDMYDGLP